MVKNIFVVGLDDFNLRLLQRVRRAEHYRFHGILDVKAVAGLGPFNVPALIGEASRNLDAFGASVDAIVGYWDFPTQLLLPLLRQSRGLRGPDLQAVLRCEHKYWARRVQQAAVPDVVPHFAAMDPFDDDAAGRPPLPFPFWLKPVKAHSSLLGFRVGNRPEFERAISKIRRDIHVFAEPLAAFLRLADLPSDIEHLPAHLCIAEAIISHGRQCTLEGYVQRGTAHIYGIVDSVRGPNRSSFARYQYPSQLPRDVQDKMIRVACQVAECAGLDDTPFNIEFYYDFRRCRLWLLEVNVRISKSHSPLFDKVTGVPHKEVMIDVAIGVPPDYPPHERHFRHAAKFMPRIYGAPEDAAVTHVPSTGEIHAIEQRYPGTDIQVHLEPGMRLGQIRHKDSYSFELATIFMGADSQRALMANYRRCLADLDIRIDHADAGKFVA